jgi:hypothetical protein
VSTPSRHPPNDTTLTSQRSAPAGWLPLRGPSGRLYGYLDPQTQTIEIKRPGKQPERIAIGDLLKR